MVMVVMTMMVMIMMMAMLLTMLVFVMMSMILMMVIQASIDASRDDALIFACSPTDSSSYRANNGVIDDSKSPTEPTR
jgi:hypothetical protein